MLNAAKSESLSPQVTESRWTVQTSDYQGMSTQGSALTGSNTESVHQVWPGPGEGARVAYPEVAAQHGLAAARDAILTAHVSAQKRPRDESIAQVHRSIPGPVLQLQESRQQWGSESEATQSATKSRRTHDSSGQIPPSANTGAASTTAILTTRGSSVVPLLGNVYKGRSGISSNRGIKSNPEVMGDPNAPTTEGMKA